MLYLKCAVCKSIQRSTILFKENLLIDKIDHYIFSARRVPDRIHYRINQCNKCGLIYSSPVFSSELITKMYKRSVFTYADKTSFLSKTYSDYLFEKTAYSSRSKLLDIGCGNGFFLTELFKQGNIDVYGVEPSKDALLKASKQVKNKIKMSFFRANIYPKNFFDIITCFHTLDHVVNPNFFINNAYKYLKKGGQVFFIVHDSNGLSVKIFGEKSPIFDIEHIYLFNMQTLRRIFLNNHFKNIKVFKIKNTYLLYDWIISSPFPSYIKNLALKIIVKTHLTQLKISLYAGNIGIIATK